MLTSHGRHRYEELDALRGVAAMTVVFWHASLFFNPPLPKWWMLLLQSPLGIPLSGPDAVYVFFVMSGFVLFLPYIRTEGADPYGKYLIKRICRIYLPFLAAVGLAIAADLLFYRAGTHAMFPRWVNWNRPFLMAPVWQHILFIRSDALIEFNPAFWSLVYEMRLSIFYPVVAWLALRLSLAWGVVVSLAICAAGFLLEFVFHTDWMRTIGYGGLFLLGALIARHLGKIRARMEWSGAWGKVLAFALAILLFKVTHFLPARFYDFWSNVPLHGAAAALVIVLAMTTVHFKRLLHTAPLQWLGKVSYSLYLIHGAVLYSLVSVFWGRTTHHVLLLGLGMLLAMALAEPLYLWVEMPAIQLGRRLTRGSQARG